MDPLELRNYGEEDFMQPDMQPMLPPQPGRDVFGKADPYRAYMDEFDEPAGKEEHNVVIIPRYAGPKNTRCDKYTQSGSEFNITGLTSHLQHSSVYLHQTFTFSTTINRENIRYTGLEGHIYVAPFAIQRQWRKLYFSAPQADNTFEMDVGMHVKLAPYLTSKQCLQNYVKTKVSAKKLTSTDAGGVIHNTYAGAGANVCDYEITVESYEPLLGFQSGWADLDCVRPFNQQHKKFPLALQDYDLRITKKPWRLEQVVKHKASCANDDTLETFLGVPTILDRAQNLTDRSDPRQRIVNVESPESSVLVSFSDDSAVQANKTVSTVQLHAPYIFAYRKRFQFPVDQMADFILKTKRQTQELIIGESGLPEKMSLQIETSKGLPSYFLIYLEDFGPNTILQGENPRAPAQWIPLAAGRSLLANSTHYDRNSFGACHPKVTGIRIKVHGDEFPVTAQLGKEELECLTQKNSHKYCDFRRNMTSDPILLLKLEDLGLANCQMGYPMVKRMKIEVDITKLMFFTGAGSTWYAEDATGAPNVELSVGLVYENHLLEGNNNRVEFLWR